MKNIIIYNNIYSVTESKIIYKFNNIETIITFKLEALPKQIYDNIIERFYNDSTIINPLIDYGYYSSTNCPKQLILNSNGQLDVSNLDIGSYNITISYTTNNISFSQIINIIIKPIILYNLESKELINLDLPILKPSGGNIFIKSNKYNNIKINSIGKFYYQNLLPNIYNFNIGYTINNITSFQELSLIYKPLLNLNNDTLTLKYGDELIISNYKLMPLGGILSCSVPYIINKNDNQIIIEYLNILNIGTHTLEFYYKFNNITTTSYLTLHLEPTLIYLNKNYKINYGKELFINEPIISHYGGLYNLNIKYNNNEYVEDNISINTNGSINLKDLEIGTYILYIIYQINLFTITDIINVIISPYLNYLQNTIYIIYSKNNKIYTESPDYYPLEGKFYLESNNNNILVNQNNGIIEINDINIGNYTIFVTYKYQKILLKQKIDIIVNPSINYNISYITIKYGLVYIINKPEISHPNGVFIINNIPKGFQLNPKTGIITVNQKENADIKLHNLIIIYKINNYNTNTNILVNII